MQNQDSSSAAGDPEHLEGAPDTSSEMTLKELLEVSVFRKYQRQSLD